MRRSPQIFVERRFDAQFQIVEFGIGNRHEGQRLGEEIVADLAIFMTADACDQMLSNVGDRDQDSALPGNV